MTYPSSSFHTPSAQVDQHIVGLAATEDLISDDSYHRICQKTLDNAYNSLSELRGPFGTYVEIAMGYFSLRLNPLHQFSVQITYCWNGIESLEYCLSSCASYKEH
jgi:hypothetical protein